MSTDPNAPAYKEQEQLMHPFVLIAHHLIALGRQVPPSPAPGGGVAPNGAGGASLPASMTSGINTLIGWVKYIGYGASAMGLIAAAATMAIAHNRGTIGEHGGKLVFAIGAIIVIAASLDIVGVLAK
jgi:hypothetical protein